MPSRHRTSFPRGRGVRRRTAWAPGPIGIASLSASGNAVITTGRQIAVDGLTLVRMRGRLSQQVSVLPLIGTNEFDAAFGVCMVSENAAGIGATAIPNPMPDVGWDGWLMYHKFLGGSSPSGAAVDNADTQFIDSKAMRKVRSTDIMVGVLGVTEIGTAGTILVSFDSRILFKLA